MKSHTQLTFTTQQPRRRRKYEESNRRYRSYFKEQLSVYSFSIAFGSSFYELYGEEASSYAYSTSP
jgi:hypothetical protein